MRKECQVRPNQNMKILRPDDRINSEEFKSEGERSKVEEDKPKRVLNQFRKKKEGPKKYKIKNRNVAKIGNKSQKKRKKRTSAIKKIEPGKPRKISKFRRATKKSLGHEKLIPLISVMRRVLNLRFIISTIKKELEERRA